METDSTSLWKASTWRDWNTGSNYPRGLANYTFNFRVATTIEARKTGPSTGPGGGTRSQWQKKTFRALRASMHTIRYIPKKSSFLDCEKSEPTNRSNCARPSSSVYFASTVGHGVFLVSCQKIPPTPLSNSKQSTCATWPFSKCRGRLFPTRSIEPGGPSTKRSWKNVPPRKEATQTPAGVGEARKTEKHESIIVHVCWPQSCHSDLDHLVSCWNQ
mmetsp:Transcript_9202/g.19948  ORF Transcript_9202/g.19948 Transcript_9202/m.19948 type:complete len:216 (-) Transcript_9202:156-803(-)